jgi:hypothetical protein
LLPFIEYQPLHDQYRFDRHWNATENAELIQQDIPEFICPTAPTPAERSMAGLTAPTSGFADYGINGRVDPGRRCSLLSTGFRDRPDWSGLFTGGEFWAFLGVDCPSDAPGSQKPLPKQTGRTYFRLATDGISHTIMYSPDAGRPLRFEDGLLKPGVEGGSRWADPDHEWWTHDLCGGLTSLLNCNNRQENFAFHVGGGMFSFGDASVHFLSEDLDLELFVSLITRAGDDAVGVSF